MTPLTLTDAEIRAAFGRRVERGRPGDIRDLVIAAIASTPQRWSWQARAAEVLSRPDRRLAMPALVAVVLLIVAMMAIALVGSHDPVPPSPGQRLVFISGGVLYVAGPPGEAPSIVWNEPGTAMLSRLERVDASSVVVKRAPGGIYVVNLITSVPRLLAADGELLALSPDHRRVAIGLDRPDGPHVEIVEIASGLLIADLTVTPTFVFPATPQIGPQNGLTGGPRAWSPDARWLLGHGLDTDASATSGWIYQLDIQTGVIHDLVVGLCCGLHQPNPVLSPDGARVVFVDYHDGGQGETCDFRCGTLWSLELTTGARTQLTPTAGSEIGPVFSPDGAAIAYMEFRGGFGYDLAVIRADGTSRQQLTRSGDLFAPAANLQPDVYLSWDADGLGLTFTRWPPGVRGETERELWHIALDGLVEQRLGTFLIAEFAR